MVEVIIPDAPAVGSVEHEIVLPSGKKAVIRQGTGKDSRLAMMAVGLPFDWGKYRYAVAAMVTKIDGKQITMEAIDAMPIADALALQGAVEEQNFPTPPRGEEQSA